MFNLDQAITDWRRQLLADGIKAPVPMEELESHLRDEIAQGQHRGLSEEQAFQQAAGAMGRTGLLKQEFEKVQLHIRRKYMINILTILAALFGSMLGGAMVLPALGRWHHTGVLMLEPLIAGSLLALVAGSAAFFRVRSYRAARGRKVIGIGIIAAGSFYVVPLLQAFFIPQTDLAGWVVCIALAGVSISFFGMCFRLNRRLRLG